jgi:NAD(P)-dependent dehydrogenase (short-subunit alcohol dehydrogenase family)
MGRIGSSQEITAAAVFLASDESAYMMGAELILDGGTSEAPGAKSL